MHDCRVDNSHKVATPYASMPRGTLPALAAAGRRPALLLPQWLPVVAAPWRASSTSRPSPEHPAPLCVHCLTPSRQQTGAAGQTHRLEGWAAETGGTPAAPVTTAQHNRISTVCIYTTQTEVIA